MTYTGARGETAKEMAKVLHFPADPDPLHASFAALQKAFNEAGPRGGYRLSVANRLWGQEGYHFLPDFLAITRDSYAAELAPVNFARQTEQARQRINDWVSERTAGKINDLIPGGVLTPLTRLVLTNAIYFKGSWTKPFPKSATKDDWFYVTGDKSMPVPFMTRSDDLRFWAGDGLKALELPYGNGDLSALLLLPDSKEEGLAALSALEAKLTLENLDGWISQLHRRKVQVFLPRFKLASQFALNDVLSAMGMKLAFDEDKADFSGISTQEQLYLSAVIHKAFVDVNEEGTEAAAATGAVIAARAALRIQEPAVFRADHPFLFLIRDNRSGSILFMGRVTNPIG
jgi:serpin B